MANGTWQGEVVLRADFSGVLGPNDGRDCPILMHVHHYWDEVESTFGGYLYHNNTFVLLCRDSETYEKDGDYYTTLHLESPNYALERMFIYQEMKFSSSPGAGLYSTADLTPTDVAYFIMRETNNYWEEFNVSLWNNSSTISNFTVHAEAAIWEAVRNCHEYNFGMLYFDRWSNLNGKPDPRFRYADWVAIASPVYDMTAGHTLDYKLIHKREGEVAGVIANAVLPDMTICNATTFEEEYNFPGRIEKLDGMVAPDEATLETWLLAYWYWLNTEWELDVTLPMGHELNPADFFGTSVNDFIPTLGDSATGEDWFVMDVAYQFDFVRGFWTRKLHAVAIDTFGD
jgi:hypothetical protein